MVDEVVGISTDKSVLKSTPAASPSSEMLSSVLESEYVVIASARSVRVESPLLKVLNKRLVTKLATPEGFYRFEPRAIK